MCVHGNLVLRGQDSSARGLGGSSCSAGHWETTLLMPWLGPSASLHPGDVPCPCSCIARPGSLQSHSSTCLQPLNVLPGTRHPFPICNVEGSQDFPLLDTLNGYTVLSICRNFWWISSPNGKEWRCTTCDVESQKSFHLPEMIEQY